MRQPVFIDQCTVHLKRVTVVAFDLPFGNELPTKLPAAMLQQSLKCRTNRAFVRHDYGLELAQCFVIILNGLVSRFEVEFVH